MVIPDLRGYGESSKPEDREKYAKSAMALDFITIIEEYKLIPFYICAHDRGARVAHKLCVDHPTHVRETILLGIAPHWPCTRRPINLRRPTKLNKVSNSLIPFLYTFLLPALP